MTKWVWVDRREAEARRQAELEARRQRELELQRVQQDQKRKAEEQRELARWVSGWLVAPNWRERSQFLLSAVFLYHLNFLACILVK